MIKLYKARSLLYRRQLLQENNRWIRLESSRRDLQDLLVNTCFCTAQTSIFQKLSSNFFAFFSTFFANIRYFRILFIKFCLDFDEIYRNFADIFEKLMLKFPEFFEFCGEILEFCKNFDRTLI